jgi:hypothetical protein
MSVVGNGGRIIHSFSDSVGVGVGVGVEDLQCHPGIAPFFGSDFVSGWGTGSNEMHFRKSVKKRCRNGAILREHSWGHVKRET